MRQSRAQGLVLLNSRARTADAFRTMVEMFGIYAVLLVGWGLYRERRAAARSDEQAAADTLHEQPATPTVAPTRKRGTAARRHLGTTP